MACSVSRSGNHSLFTILNIIGIKHDQNARSLSVADEIRGTVDLHHKEGRLFKMDKDMVTGILDLSETTVEDIMVHRSNIFTVNIDEDPEKIINQKKVHLKLFHMQKNYR